MADAMLLPIINATNIRIGSTDLPDDGTGSTAIKCPTDLGFELYKIEKGGRVASGLMCIDIIARKKKFTFSYDVLSGAELKKILDLLNGTSAYYKMWWVDFDGEHCCVIYPGAFKFSKFRMHGGIYYKKVTFDLIER